MVEPDASVPGLIARGRARLTRVVTWVTGLLVVRVWVTYAERRGPVLAAGLGYHALFAGFAALWVGFSIAGVIVSGDLGLREEALTIIRTVVPGLIADDDGQGIVDPDLLLNANLFGISGIAALGGLVLTALTWPSAASKSVRAVAGLPPSPTNLVLRRLRDLAFGVALAILIALTSLLGVAATGASELVIDWLGWSSDLAILASRIATIVGVVILEAATMLGLYRLLAGLRAPRRILTEGIALATVGLTALTMGGSLLAGSATSNPLIASFAVIAGVLIYFNFVGQVILVGATWIAVRAADVGQPIPASARTDDPIEHDDAAGRPG